MVLINFDTNKIDRLTQSIDFAIRDLIEENDDSFSLSVYLYTLTKHDATSINTDRLASWGVDWIRTVFIEKQIGKRRDETIASASLAIISLQTNPSLQAIKEELTENFKEILSIELDQNEIPFRRPSYAVILLLAAHTLSVENNSLIKASKKVGEAIISSVSGQRLFDLSFGIQLLQTIEETQLLEAIKTDIEKALDNLNTNYEDKIFLLQGLWELNSSKTPNTHLMDMTERVLKKSPAWQYMMNGIEDISPAGDGQTIIFLSHLFRSALMDVLQDFQSNLEFYNETSIDARYSARAGISWAAFGFFLLLISIIWLSLLFPLIYYRNEAVSYWINNNYTSMWNSLALLYLFGIQLIIYLGIITIRVLPLLYSIFIKSKIGSDERIKEALLPNLWMSTKIWLGIIAIEVLLGAFVELIIPGLENIIGRPK